MHRTSTSTTHQTIRVESVLQLWIELARSSRSIRERVSRALHHHQPSSYFAVHVRVLCRDRRLDSWASPRGGSTIIDRSLARRIDAKSQDPVLERFDISLEHLLKLEYSPPKIVPHRLVAMIVSQVGSALLHLERHRVAHRDIKLDNILVELNPDHRREEPTSLPIKRCVVSDFGTACTLAPDLKDLMAVGPGGNPLSSMWGNQAHIAPELHSALNHAILAQRSSPKASHRLEIEIDFSGQPVFELGVLAFEIVLGTTPIDDYPASVTDRTTGAVRFKDSKIARIPTYRLGVDQASMLRRMVSCDPSRRPSLEAVLSFFDPHREYRLE